MLYNILLITYLLQDIQKGLLGFQSNFWRTFILFYFNSEKIIQNIVNGLNQILILVVG